MYYSSAIYLIYYFSKKFFADFFYSKLNGEQIFLKKITGKTFEKTEAEHLWKKINEHKWFLGEQLGRDIGIGAATLDYLENFTGETYFSEDKTSDFYADLNNSFA